MIERGIVTLKNEALLFWIVKKMSDSRLIWRVIAVPLSSIL